MGKRKIALRILGVILGAAVFTGIAVWAGSWALDLRDPVKLAEFRQRVDSLGAAGLIALLALQYFQIIIAFIPGGAVQIAAGVILGAWGGLALCLFGSCLATGTVFWLVSRYGRGAVKKFVGERELKAYKFLEDEKRLERLVFIMFLIPGAPKDALTYIFALTKIPLARFLLISTVARAPAMATSLVAGESITSGDWGRALFMFCVMTLFGAAGLFFHGRLKEKHSKS